MRKLAAFLTFTLLFSACSEILPDDKKQEPAQFKASVETPAGDVESLRIALTDDDRISVFAGNTGNQQYRYSGSSAAFSIVDDSSTASGSKLNANYAVYPYQSGSTITGSGTVAFTFPSVQKYAPDGLGDGAITMVAATSGISDYNLKFKNACGYLKVSLYGDATIKSITLRGNDGEKIAGPGSIVVSSTAAPAVMILSYAKEETITLDCGEGVKLGADQENATTFYFAVPPVEFSQGIIITAIDTEGKEFENLRKEPITVVRNVIENVFDDGAVLVGGTYVPFVDDIFKEYCVKNFDTDGDGEISFAEAAVVERIECSGFQAITSMMGVQYFTSLTHLGCASNLLTSLDVSKNTALTYLDCSGNDELTSLDVSKNTALTYLKCSFCKLTSLDVSQNTSLAHLSCVSNQLTGLDVGMNTALAYLDCRQNQLESLDVSNNAALAYLNCRLNKLTSLDVSKNTALTYLDCGFNSLTILDICKSPALSYLDCVYNELTSLDVRTCTALTELICGNNQLKDLDVSKNTALTCLTCWVNQLTGLDVSNNTALVMLECDYNNLTSLDISKNVKLATLDCSPMDDANGKNLLDTLYIYSGQYVQGVTADRDEKFVPKGTEIVVVE